MAEKLEATGTIHLMKIFESLTGQPIKSKNYFHLSIFATFAAVLILKNPRC